MFICQLLMLFIRKSCISSLDPSSLLHSAIDIVDHERVAYCISLHLTLKYLTLALNQSILSI